MDGYGLNGTESCKWVAVVRVNMGHECLQTRVYARYIVKNVAWCRIFLITEMVNINTMHGDTKWVLIKPRY